MPRTRSSTVPGSSTAGPAPAGRGRPASAAPPRRWRWSTDCARREIAAATPLVAGNPIATALVERSAALLDDDRARLLATEAAFTAAGCPYQAARTLLLAGGDVATTGAAALTTLGLA
jgi:hypothetical protein